MKIVYGNPKTIMTMGMAMLGNVPTPFFGFVDRIKVESSPFFASGTDSTALINQIDADGGVVIYLENPDAAQRMHEMMAALFLNACGGEWETLEQVEAGLQ